MPGSLAQFRLQTSCDENIFIQPIQAISVYNTPRCITQVCVYLKELNRKKINGKYLKSKTETKSENGLKVHEGGPVVRLAVVSVFRVRKMERVQLFISSQSKSPGRKAAPLRLQGGLKQIILAANHTRGYNINDEYLSGSDERQPKRSQNYRG